jgi:hypothetical protein
VSPTPKQPKGTAPALYRPEVYPGTMYAELQKFGKTDRQMRQLALSEIRPQHAEAGPVEISGLDLDISQDKALSAVQLLLSRTNYEGNLPGVYVRSPDYRWEGILPGLAFTVPEYLEAYGLQKNKRGAFPGRQRKLALEALKSLCLPRRVVYKKPRWEKGKKLYDVIVVYKPLIEMLEGYFGLEEAEAATVEQGENLPDRLSVIGLRPSPLLLDGLANFYLLKPATLHKELEALVAKKRGTNARVPRAYSLFVEWLLTRSHAEEKVSRDTLVTKLRLESYRDQRKLKKAYGQIDEALEHALELEYLLSYEKDVFGVFTLRLNPEKCSRVKLGEPEQQEETEA